MYIFYNKIKIYSILVLFKNLIEVLIMIKKNQYELDEIKEEFTKEKEINTFTNINFYKWLIIFLILPMIVECMIYFVENGCKIEVYPAIKKIFYIARDYKSYYATILTLSFAIFSFNKQQDKLLEEKQKENELKKKEQEDKKDYYRPIFVVEKEKKIKKVRLLMKDSNLYLENIKFHELKEGKYITHKIIPSISNTIIREDVQDSFYITAQTLIGETILFYYKYNNIKVYKYLKPNKSPIYPVYIANEKSSQNKIEEVWGTFNSSSNSFNTEVDQTLSTFFEQSFPIRTSLVTDEIVFFDDLFKIDTLESFYLSVFHTLDNYLNIFEKTEKLTNLLINLINEGKKINKQGAIIMDRVQNSDILEKLESKEFLGSEFVKNFKEVLEKSMDKLDSSTKSEKDNLEDLLNNLYKIMELFNEYEKNPSVIGKTKIRVHLNNLKSSNIFTKDKNLTYFYDILSKLDNTPEDTRKVTIYYFKTYLCENIQRYSKELSNIKYRLEPIVFENLLGIIKHDLENNNNNYNIVLKVLIILFDSIEFNDNRSYSLTLNECKTFLLEYLGYLN